MRGPNAGDEIHIGTGYLTNIQHDVRQDHRPISLYGGFLNVNVKAKRGYTSLFDCQQDQ
jgi:hypothetical protein